MNRRLINVKLGWGIWLLGLCGLLISSSAMDSLEHRNPLGYQTLNVPDYIHYIPNTEPVAGDLVMSYSGTSELFVEKILHNLEKMYPTIPWAKEARKNFTSSDGVIEYLVDGHIPMGVSSIPMTSAEREEFIRRFGYPILEARVALDAIQILVHPSNPLTSVTIPQLDAMFGKELRAGATSPIRIWSQIVGTSWGTGRSVQAYAGYLGYGTSQFFQQAVLQGGPWRDDIQKNGSVENPKRILKTNMDAICFSNYRPRDEQVKIISVARQTQETAFPPTPTYIYEEEYPLIRYFYIYANVPRLTPPAFEFLDYLLSYEGQVEIALAGNLPLDLRMLLRSRKQMGLLDP